MGEWCVSCFVFFFLVPNFFDCLAFSFKCTWHNLADYVSGYHGLTPPARQVPGSCLLTPTLEGWGRESEG